MERGLQSVRVVSAIKTRKSAYDACARQMLISAKGIEVIGLDVAKQKAPPFRSSRPRRVREN